MGIGGIGKLFVGYFHNKHLLKAKLMASSWRNIKVLCYISGCYQSSFHFLPGHQLLQHWTIISKTPNFGDLKEEEHCQLLGTEHKKPLLIIDQVGGTKIAATLLLADNLQLLPCELPPPRAQDCQVPSLILRPWSSSEVLSPWPMSQIWLMEPCHLAHRHPHECGNFLRWKQ